MDPRIRSVVFFHLLGLSFPRAKAQLRSGTPASLRDPISTDSSFSSHRRKPVSASITTIIAIQ